MIRQNAAALRTRRGSGFPRFWPFTHWYIRWCYRPAGHWFSGNGYVRWIGTSVTAGYRNCDFGWNDRCTFIYNKMWTYGNGYGRGSNVRDWNAYGERYWLLYPGAAGFHYY